MKRPGENFWRGVFLIFATYFYFLIFAQFGFLELIRQDAQNASPGRLKLVMGMMALGGLAGSVTVPLVCARFRMDALLRAGLAGCAATALVLVLPAGAHPWIAFAIGAALGVATVSLAASLRTIFPGSWALGAALGTGCAYTAANVPAIFQGTPEFHTLSAALVAGIASMFVPKSSDVHVREKHPPNFPFIGAVVVCFGILVWFDSAAFYVIQHTGLKLGTWGDPASLWRNAAVHFVAAITAGVLLRRAGFVPLLAGAFLLLAVAALSADQPALRPLVGWLYPAGVSIYSACLVCFPAFGANLSKERSVAWAAAILYAFSGWICSGLGIGMAENLQRIPWQFVAAAAGLLCLALLARQMLRLKRELLVVALALALAWISSAYLPRPREPGSPIERGRQVYLAEGCINCHSQFVKPGRDEILWGPSVPVEALTAQEPPLFGNRRQGPDLMNIGNRRSAAWLKLHFLRPRDLAPGSSMPSYAHLFSDARGEALIAYLQSLGAGRPRGTGFQNWAMPAATKPSPNAPALFQQHCAFCHDSPEGRDALAAAGFRKLPPSLATGPFIWAPAALPAEARVPMLARIVKFGLPGADMAGHEHLSDADVIALALHIEQISKGESCRK